MPTGSPTCSRRAAESMPPKRLIKVMDDYKKENFEQVEDLDNYDTWILPHRFTAPIGAVILWMGVIFFYPRVWAIGTAAALAMSMGFGTAKGIFKIKSNTKALALSPAIGVLWIGFFYLLFELMED